MKDGTVRAAAVTFFLALIPVALGIVTLGGSNLAIPYWLALFLVSIGGAVGLGGLSALVVMLLRASREKVEPEPPPRQIGAQLPERPSLTYWAGRPRTLGAGFVGRDKDRQVVSDAFDTRDAVIISGGAGSGKSRLAAQYTHDAGVPGFWTAAGSSVVETLVGLAGALGVRLAERAYEEIAGEVQRRLAEFPPETLWVVDNLEDIELVNGLLSALGSVRLLITSRDSRHHLLPAAVAYHRTEALQDEAAIELLRSKSKTPPNDPALARIAEKVGRLPLALEVLAARLAEPRRTPESVLAQLDRAPTAIQMDAFQQASGGSIPRVEAEGVFVAIAGTLEDLSAEDRGALAGLAYIADAPVPDPLAAALTGLDGEELTGLLSRCSRQSVLSWDEGQVKAHALTVSALAATNPEGALEVALARANLRLAKINTDDPVALRAELVHHEAMHSEAQVRLGPDEESVPSFGNNLAIGYNEAGRFGDAIGLWEQALEVRERVLGPEHHDTLGSRSNLAVGYRTAGRTDDAIKLWEQTQEVMERVLGLEHPDTLTSRSNLAEGYRAAGRTEDAVRLHEQTLEVRERVLGPEHPDTLSSRSNLAIGYGAAGRIEDAVRLHEQTLEVRERLLGPDHPDTLQSRGNLANGYHAAGRTEDALQLDEHTLEVMQRVLGPEHPDTLSSRNNLAIDFRTAGRIEGAIRLHEQTLEARERVLGPEHPDTLIRRNNLAEGYRAAGRTEDAIGLAEHTLEVMERALGPEHPNTLGNRINLAASYYAAGRTEDAIKLWELEARERVLGPEHPDTLGSRSNLAIGYRAAGRTEDARRLESPG